MSRNSEIATSADGATALHAPPVRQATTVRSDVGHTFETFVRTIGTWWPVKPLSFELARVRDVTIDQRLGGRVYETWDDGTTVDWGEVTAWIPPFGLTMSWTSTPEPTAVELTFRALGPVLTHVALEHRGWDALTAQQLREDCAAPGGYRSGSYAAGWTRVLEVLSVAVERAPAGAEGEVR